MIPVMNESWRHPAHTHIRSGWNESSILRGKRLTDRKISQYQKRGFYSDDFRQQRREMQEKKKRRRTGNFDVSDDGRLIYRPV